MKSCGLWIDGSETAAVAGRTFDVENPATRQVIARVAEGCAEDVDRAVAAASRAYRAYTQTQTIVVRITNEPFDLCAGGGRYS